jgi:hypothetical protein
MNDLAASRLLSIAGPQHEYPWPAHLRGLVGHVLGVVTDSVLDARRHRAVSRGGGCLREALALSGRVRRAFSRRPDGATPETGAVPVGVERPRLVLR